ncbi:MAG: DTW domain-containing protein [Pirellulaceae bacterium]|nr:DTW domain-containing protein [Pirellulaceae bacterium]
MRRLVSQHRCPSCEIRRPLCYCELIPQITLRTRVIILMHVAEESLTTNTARLAAKALLNSDLRIRGRKEECSSTDDFVQSGRTSLLLYPSPNAVELSAHFVSTLNSPVNLIVPDGSWSQTRKFVRREASLAGIRHVKLPKGRASEYRLRIQPQADGLCTLEAIARSLGILESCETQQRLEALLRVMVERTLWSRGSITANACTAGGIPERAFFS